MPAVPTKLQSVQALRAVAALAVVMCHLHGLEVRYLGESALLGPIWVNGASGVDLFFVISGFIMVWVAGDTQVGPAGAGPFIYARLTRIYPLWWLFAAAMAAYFYLAYGVPWDAERLAREGMSGPSHLVLSALLWPQAGHPVLGVGWTLVHEMYFYVVFAIVILALPARWRLPALLLWGTIVALGGAFGLSDKHAGTVVELVFYPMSLQFLMGALVAYALKAGWRKGAVLSAILGTGLNVAVFLTFDFRTGGLLLSGVQVQDMGALTLGFGRTFCFGIPAALLVYGLVALELDKRLALPVPRLLVAIGDWSYALYLGHLLVISAVARVLFPHFAMADSVIDSLGFIALAIVASVLVSALTYKLFERPTLRLLRRLSPRALKSPRPA